MRSLLSWVESFAKSLFLLIVVGLVFQGARIVGFYGWQWLSAKSALILMLISFMVMSIVASIVVLAFSYHLLNTLLIALESPIFQFQLSPPGVDCWKKGLTGAIVATCSSMVTILVMSPFVYPRIIYGYSRTWKYIFYDLIEEELPSQIIVAWIIAAAFLYQYDSWVRRRRQKRSSLPMPMTKKKSHPIDIELNQLRGEMGITDMTKKSHQKHK